MCPSACRKRYSLSSRPVCLASPSSLITCARSSGWMRSSQSSGSAIHCAGGKPSIDSICGLTYRQRPAAPASQRYAATGTPSTSARKRCSRSCSAEVSSMSRRGHAWARVHIPYRHPGPRPECEGGSDRPYPARMRRVRVIVGCLRAAGGMRGAAGVRRDAGHPDRRPDRRALRPAPRPARGRALRADERRRAARRSARRS